MALQVQTLAFLVLSLHAYAASECQQDSQSNCLDVPGSQQSALLQVKASLGEHRPAAASEVQLEEAEDDSRSESIQKEEVRGHPKSHSSKADADEGRLSKSDADEVQQSENATSNVIQGARIAPFGKEDTSRELQHHAARTQDTLVDAIENAEVAEIKRSIFRSLTRLRAAEIKEFDTIARLETQAIDEYNDNHHYRAENPLDYIHGAEPKVKEDKYTSFHD